MDTIARMHTAEHLLSAVMRKYYSAPRNVEFHLGKKKTKCDYQPGRPLTDADVEQIALQVNREIQKDHPVTDFELKRGQAQGYDLWKVPPEAETIRIVKIGDFDEQPCGGQHVARTKQIGSFKILSYERKESNRIRIRFKVED